MSAPLPIGDATVALSRAAEGERLREAAEAFESMLFQLLLRQMREAQLERGFFGEGAGHSIYEGLFETHLSGRLSQGSPLGIASMLLEQWSRGDAAPEAAERALRWIERDRALRAWEAAAENGPGTGPIQVTPERTDPIDEPSLPDVSTLTRRPAEETSR